MRFAVAYAQPEQTVYFAPSLIIVFGGHTKNVLADWIVCRNVCVPHPSRNRNAHRCDNNIAKSVRAKKKF